MQGADRLQVPNSVLISLVVPLREPPKVNLKARFSHEASPRRIEEQLLAAIPLHSDDGSQLAEEVLATLRPAHARSG